MDKALAPVRARFMRGGSFSAAGAAVFLMFGVGIVLGALLGCLSPELSVAGDGDMLSALSSGSVYDSVYKVAFYVVLALIFSTSYLGVFLIPALALVRGYSLACSVAALYVSFSARGLIGAAVAVGIPALFSVPAFFVCACGGLEASMRLYSLRFGSGYRPPMTAYFSRRAAFAALCLAIALLYDIFALPLLLGEL